MKKLQILTIAIALVACGKKTNESASGFLSPKSFAEELKSDSDIILIDVRSSAEMQTGYIKGAYHLDFNKETFSNSLDSLDHSKKYFVYCASGIRSGKALKLMTEKGFKDVASLEGGLRMWNASGLPMIQPQPQ